MTLKINPWTKLALYIGRFTNPLFYLFDQGQKEVIYKFHDAKFKIRVNSADKFTIWETWKFKSYTYKGFDIQSSDTVIDLGAHIGAFSIYAAQKAKNGQVLAFEPEPDNFRLLTENKSLNKVNNLHIFKQAVMGHVGKIKLFVEHASGTINTAIRNDDPIYKQTLTVPATTLEKIINDHKIVKVDFLKIDIEGTEYEVLFNTPISVMKKIDKISLEYHDHFNQSYNIKKLEKYLQAQGFKTKISYTLFTWILKFGLLKAWR